MSEGDTLGGLLLRVDGAERFVSALVALRVAPTPRVTPVPGAPPELLGVALHEGAVVAVLVVGSARGEMIVCHHAGELVGLVGCEVIRVGSFAVMATQPDWIEHEGRPVKPLDLAAIYGGVQASARPGRWGS